MSAKIISTKIFATFAYVPKIKFRKAMANQALLTPPTPKHSLPSSSTNNNIQRKPTTGKGIIIPTIKSPILNALQIEIVNTGGSCDGSHQKIKSITLNKK